MHESLQIIDSIQLIPVENFEISPLISKVKIKIFYLGENRNGSYIDKPTALSMSKTLRGCPIVGKYDKQKEDFTDHGEVIKIDHNGVNISVETVPYGFIDLNSEIWFEDYQEIDEKGRSVTRTYLVTEGYVWSGQYPELELIFNDGGRPHSMELDEKTLQGAWTKIDANAPELFIINDAIFSKLCILGEDVEPCFEGSSIVSSEISSNFSLESKDFIEKLTEMIKELKDFTYSLKDKGGEGMAILEENSVQTPEEESIVLEGSEFTAAEGETTPEVETEVPAEESEVDTTETPVDNFTEESVDPATEENVEIEDKNNQEINTENQNTIEEFTETSENEVVEEENISEKYALLEQSYKELEEKYSLLEKANAELTTFKINIENKEKDALIASFYMLSDEDKKNVIENKANYTLDDIEKELSVICVRKRVSFDNSDENNLNVEQKDVLTYNLNDVEQDTLPAWLKAVEDYAHNN